MRKALAAAIALVAGVSIAGGIASPTAANAFSTAKKYSSCPALNSAYPNGVAPSTAAAGKAVAAGWRRPTVSPKVYRTNRSRVDEPYTGVLCGRLASNTATSAPKPVAVTPPAVTNLTLVPDTPVEGDVRATYTISWQMPATTPVQNYVVTFPGEPDKKVVAASSGVWAGDVVTYSHKAYAPFDAWRTVRVVATNNGLSGPEMSRTVLMPAAPPEMVTVQLTAGGPACGMRQVCNVSFRNATGGEEAPGHMGSWSYRVPAGTPVGIRVSAETDLPNGRRVPEVSSCQIRVDGVIVATQTSDTHGVFCFAVAR